MVTTSTTNYKHEYPFRLQRISQLQTIAVETDPGKIMPVQLLSASIEPIKPGKQI